MAKDTAFASVEFGENYAEGKFVLQIEGLPLNIDGKRAEMLAVFTAYVGLQDHAQRVLGVKIPLCQIIDTIAEVCGIQNLKTLRDKDLKPVDGHVH